MNKIKIKIDQLHPTQFVIGLDVIKLKIEKVEKLYSQGKLESYLQKKRAPAVIGPDGKYYILDHHHLSRALFEADIPEKSKRLHIKIKKKRFDHASYNEFYQHMIKKKYVYLKITGNGAGVIEKLPTHVKDLTNDPYRTLAWLIREQGAYEKLSIPFLEFLWAEYLFEEGLRIKDGKITEELIIQAIKLASSNKASHLPGYKKQRLSCNGLFKNILHF